MMFPKPINKCRCGCGESIAATKKWVSGHNLRRRPKDAIVKNGRTYKNIKCSTCETTISRRSDQIKECNYCNSCLGAFRSKTQKGVPIPRARTGSYLVCTECKKTYYVTKARLLNTKSSYCSNECQFKRQKLTGYTPKGFISSTNNKGKRNGRYKHGKRVGAHINKKDLRNMVIERDGGNWCLLCGLPGPGLHLHRIKYASQGGKYELDNCVQLCAVHHDEVHSNKNKWMPILLDHIENDTLYRSEWDD